MCSIDQNCFYEMTYGSENHDSWLERLNYPKPDTLAKWRKILALQDQMMILPSDMMPIVDLLPFAQFHRVSPFGMIVAEEIAKDVKALATPFTLEGVLTNE